MTNGLHRLRIVVVVAMAAVIATAAGDVFDRLDWWLLAAPGLVGAAALLTMRRRWTLRVAAGLIALVAAVIVVVLTGGGDSSDIAASFGSGFQRLLSTDWPSPDRPDLLGTVAGVLALMTGISAELARRARLHLTPLLPLVLGHLGVIAMSAPGDLRLRWLLPLAVLAIALATLRPAPGIDLRDRINLLRGERRLIPVALIAVGLAAGLAAPIVLANRADPRRNEPAERSATLLDPIEATLALQKIDPPVDLHDIRIQRPADELTTRTPLRWRTAALSDYDGRRWAPDLTLRPIGRRLGPPSDESVTATVSFLDDDLQLVPLPGSAITIDADIETDPGRTIVRLSDRPSGTEPIDITAMIEPTLTGADPGLIGTRDIDENAIGLTELTAALVEVGGATPNDDLLTQLRAIETTMRDDFVLRSDASGGGLQRALIERFLRDTQRGNAEQFSTGFVLLARSLGADARIATGFAANPDEVTRTEGLVEFTLGSNDAEIWPEVRVGQDWVAFDPVPPEEASDPIAPEPDDQVQTPAAPQPPIALPPESADQPVVTEDDADDTTNTGIPVVVAYALWVSAGIGALLVPVLLAIALILGLKWRKRRRRLAGAPEHRIHGAWAVATDRLVDAGMAIDAADTNDEIATAATTAVPTAHRELHRLATLASATTFGAPVRPDLLAEDAAVCLGQVEASMAQDRSTLQRWWWRLNLRSLRRKTSSPV
ncbi:MAG: DUF3488 and transglutaminase-like domain-containing protein [Ilumatobacter sp.]